MIIKNYMENIVFDMIDKVLARFEGCKCEKCRSDIAAYALNHLPPRYIVSNEVYTKINTLHQQFDVDVMAQISAGARLVMGSPRH